MSAATERAVAELTTTEAAVLALLMIEGEHSGYDLMKLVTKSIAHVWSPARSGLYAVLPRLERAGLVSSRHVSQTTRPDKQLYTITRAGRGALHQWFLEVEPGAGDSFYLKVFVGGLAPDAVRAHVEQFRADVGARLAVYRQVETSNTNQGHDWFHRHLLRLGIGRAEHDLAWAESVLRALRRGPR